LRSRPNPGKKARPYLKDNQRKRTVGMAQVVEHLPHKHKVLSSNPILKKKKKKEKVVEELQNRQNGLWGKEPGSKQQSVGIEILEKPGLVAYTCLPSTWEVESEGLIVQGQQPGASSSGL
jgi:predicted ribonuclease YlaK